MDAHDKNVNRNKHGWIISLVFPVSLWQHLTTCFHPFADAASNLDRWLFYVNLAKGSLACLG